MHYSQIAGIMALAALAAPAAALPAGRDAADLGSASAAALEARYTGPHNAVGPYISRQIKKTHQRVAAHNAQAKNNKIKDPEMDKTKKPAAKGSKRDVQPEEAEEEAVEEEAADEAY